MNRIGKILAVGVCAISLAGCVTSQGGQGGYSSAPSGNKQLFGTILGGVGGGVVGNQFGKGKGNTAMTILGALVGAGIGSSIGQSLDRADQMAHMQTQQAVFNRNPDGVAGGWQNPNRGTAGQIMPTQTYQSGNTYCREFTQTIQVGRQAQQAYGTACRQPDGTWQVQ